MRFMCIYKPANTNRVEAGLPPSQNEMAEMGNLIGDMIKAGVLLATDGLLPSSKGARARLPEASSRSRTAPSRKPRS